MPRRQCSRKRHKRGLTLGHGCLAFWLLSFSMRPSLLRQQALSTLCVSHTQREMFLRRAVLPLRQPSRNWSILVDCLHAKRSNNTASYLVNKSLLHFAVLALSCALFALFALLCFEFIPLTLSDPYKMVLERLLTKTRLEQPIGCLPRCARSITHAPSHDVIWCCTYSADVALSRGHQVPHRHTRASRSLRRHMEDG
jgi:hypothetical protein